MRVLHGPVNVGNQPWVLSRYERLLGVKSDLVVNYSTWLGYQADRCLSDYAKRSVRAIMARLAFGLSAPWRYQVLHYYFGRSFLCWDDYSSPMPWWFSDLKLAKRLGRKVFMTLQGCDVRLSHLSATRNAFTPCHVGHCQAVPSCRMTLDAQRQRLINDILPQVDRVFVLNPELAHYVPGAVFLPYASVDVEAIAPVWPKPHGPVVILHAPSDEGIKGSRLIIEAVERLRQRIPLEFIVVKGIPHAEAMQLYGKADLVIDQILAGWYGGFAVEAMAMGKPVACYIREADLRHVPEAMRAELPLVRLTPATLDTDLAALLTRRAEWPQWGRQARAFVLRWHHPRRLAAAMVRAYQDPGSRFHLEVA
jgi:glycosyltransferase involved in cell wall biosynthesis